MTAQIDASILRAAAAVVAGRWPEQAELAATLARDADALDPISPPLPDWHLAGPDDGEHDADAIAARRAEDRTPEDLAAIRSETAGPIP